MKNLIAISGSLRKDSYNTALINAAKELAPESLSITLAHINDIPVYSSDTEGDGIPESVLSLAEAIRSADGVLISTPEYNYSFPGGLKNTIDWLSRVEDQPFAAKPVALMGASMGGQGTSRAQYHLRQVFVYLDGRVMNKPELMVGGAHTKFDDQGQLTDESTRKYLSRFLGSVLGWIG